MHSSNNETRVTLDTESLLHDPLPPDALLTLLQTLLATDPKKAQRILSLSPL